MPGSSGLDEWHVLSPRRAPVKDHSVLGIPTLLFWDVAGKMKYGVMQRSSERRKQEDAELDAKGQYPNPWPVTSEPVPDKGFNGNGRYAPAAADARPPQHGAALAQSDFHEVLTPIFRSATARGARLVEDAYRLLFCAVRLQLYGPTPHQVPRCGYPGPAGAMRLQGDRVVHSSLKTCCRVRSSSIPTGGKYYATNARFFNTGRRYGVEVSCCGISATQPGCQLSEYHVCAEPRGKCPLSPLGFVSTCPRPVTVDCEMCFTTHGLEVTKVSVMSCNGLPVYCDYLGPQCLDSDSSYSGAAAEHLGNVGSTSQNVPGGSAPLLRRFRGVGRLSG